MATDNHYFVQFLVATRGGMHQSELCYKNLRINDFAFSCWCL